MALSERHRWCASKIVEAFKPEINNDAVQAFIRNEKNLNAFSTFFRGESSGRLFVFYQPERTTIGEDEVRILFLCMIELCHIFMTFFCKSGL